MYYYAKDGHTLGPYHVDELINLIDADTLVYKDGIGWTNANKVEDLKKYFQKNEPDLPHKSDYSDEQNQPIEYNYFVAPFSFNGRIRRSEYFFSILVYLVLYGVFITMAEVANIFILLLIPSIWFILAQGSKRCHDLGNSGWFQLIPFYSLLMMFKEGEKRHNNYGLKTKK